MHSDASYLGGLGLQDGAVQRVGPPAVLMLQVAQAAGGDGGDDVLCDGAQLVEHFLNHDPPVLKTLLTPSCVSFTRDD